VHTEAGETKKIPQCEINGRHINKRRRLANLANSAEKGLNLNEEGAKSKGGGGGGRGMEKKLTGEKKKHCASLRLNRPGRRREAKIVLTGKGRK